MLKNDSLVEEVKYGENEVAYQLWVFALNVNRYSTEAVESVADFKE